jgi:hypothetical protein
VEDDGNTARAFESLVSAVLTGAPYVAERDRSKMAVMGVM